MPAPRPSSHPAPPRLLPPPRLPPSQLLGRTRPLLLPTDVGQYDAFQYVAAAGSRQVRCPRHTGVPSTVLPCTLAGNGPTHSLGAAVFSVPLMSLLLLLTPLCSPRSLSLRCGAWRVALRLSPTPLPHSRLPLPCPQVWRVEGGGFVVRPVLGSGVAGSRDCEERALRTAVSFLGDEVRPLSSPSSSPLSRPA